MARLTRTESQQRNRTLLLAAARDLFLRDGYQATSLAAVADAAGFSTGVVYSNFSGKADLARLVLGEIQAEQLSAVRTALRPGQPMSEQLEAISAWAERALASGWPRFELEFALDSRTDPALVAFEAERHSAATEALTEILRTLTPPTLAPLVPTRAAAEACLNLAIGLAVRHIIDPTVTVDSMIGPLRDLLSGLEAPA